MPTRKSKNQSPSHPWHISCWTDWNITCLAGQWCGLKRLLGSAELEWRLQNEAREELGACGEGMENGWGQGWVWQHQGDSLSRWEKSRGAINTHHFPYILQLLDDLLVITFITSIRFGGYYQGSWFASGWPPQFDSFLPQSAPLCSPRTGPHRNRCPSLGTLMVAKINPHLFRKWSHCRYCKQRLVLFPCYYAAHPQTHSHICPTSVYTSAHVPDHQNRIADSLSRFSLSRFSIQKFRFLASASDFHPTQIPPFSDTIFK